MAESTDPLAQAYAAYEQLEARLSSGLDSLVATNGFAELFTTSATNVMALVRMANGAVDQAVKLTRLAAKPDVVSLARQLARTEDKLEKLLQLVEELQAEIERLNAQKASSSAGAKDTPVAAANGSTTRRRRPTVTAAAKS